MNLSGSGMVPRFGSSGGSEYSTHTVRSDAPSTTPGAAAPKGLRRTVLSRFRRGTGDDDALAEDSLFPVTAIQAEDVVIAGYPKSGNTWIQHLLAGAAVGL